MRFIIGRSQSFIALHRPYGFVCAFDFAVNLLFYLSLLRDVHEYWRNFTSYIQIYHPLKDSYSSSPFHQRTISRRTNYSFPLPLRDREVTTNFTISCLASLMYIASQIKPINQICSLTPNYYLSCYLLLRNGWHTGFSHQSSFIQRKVTAYYSALSPMRGHPFFVKHVNLRFHNIVKNRNP